MRHPTKVLLLLVMVMVTASSAITHTIKKPRRLLDNKKKRVSTFRPRKKTHFNAIAKKRVGGAEEH
jgi:hypothetical protein